MTIGFKARNLVISLLSFEILQKRDEVALNLLRQLAGVVSPFLTIRHHRCGRSLPDLRLGSDSSNKEKMTAW
jgi:hypothetical protein